MENLEAVKAFLYRMLRGEVAPPTVSGKRQGKFTKKRRLDRYKRKHLRDIQKMSRVKNRAA